MSVETTEPREPRDLAGKVARFLTAEMGRHVEVIATERVTAGARRSNTIIAATVDGEAAEFVLTQTPPHSDAFGSIETEAAWIERAHRAGVRAAPLVAVAPEAEPLGAPGFVTERVGGVTIPKHVVATCAATPGLGATVAFELGASLARLHRVDPTMVPPSPAPGNHAGYGVGAAGDPIDAALDWANERFEELLVPSPPFAATLRWLELRRPATTEVVAVHGDVRNGNIIVNQSGLGAILDWETAHLGDPYDDLAWLAQRMWRAGSDRCEIGGFASRRDLRAGYCSEGAEWDDARFEWWKVFRTLWWGLTLAEQARCHLDGTFPSIVMAASGRRVAELEWDALSLIAP